MRFVPIRQGDSVEGIEMVFPVCRGDREVGLVTRRRLPLPRHQTLVSYKVLNGGAASVAFLPASGLSDEKSSAMWDALVQRPGQELVLGWLRILDPRIEDLAYVSAGQDARIALLKLRGKSRIPLRTMGDGLTKLFHIALAVASASQGILLVDEFENGLHWGVQEKLWLALADAARKSNVQVFATTHSRDCIEGFAAAVKTAALDGASIYRFERSADDVCAVELPLLNVAAAMREHAEVR